MADTKLTALTALTAGQAVNDLRLICDVSDTTQGAGGTDKKMTIADDVAMSRAMFSNVSTARVLNAAGATDTYLSGSAIALPSGYPIVGSRYRCKFDISKTAVGTATPIIIVRIGTAGTTADTARCTFTFAAGTAAVDAGEFEVDVSFRTVGSTTTAVLVGACRLVSNLSTTGLSNAKKAVVVVSAGFDSTVASTFIGVSYNGGASAVHTCERVVSNLDV